MNVARSTSLIVAFSCALAFAVGCGGGDSGVEPVGKARAAQPSPEARRQVADPQSAAAAVLKYWESIKFGSLPLSLSLYTSQVVNDVGLPTFAGGLAALRPSLRETRLNVTGVQRVAEGHLVSAEALPKIGAKTEHSFFLRNQGSGWRILYDTLTAAGIQQYAQDQVQRGIDSSAPPSARAIKAGDSALSTYRQSSLSRVRPVQRP